MRVYSGPQIQYGAVRQASTLHEPGWSYVTPHLPFSLATSATAGVSAPVKTTSAPASNSEAAPSRSLTGSCQVLMKRTSIVHSGQVTLAPTHDRVAEAQFLGDRERGHVAELGVAVGLGARAGDHPGEVLHVLDGAEEVAEVLAVRLVAGQMEERLVREFLGDGRHRVHVAERGADDEVEALAREAAEDLLGVRALGDELDVRDVAVRRRARTGTAGPRTGPGSSRRRRVAR